MKCNKLIKAAVIWNQRRHNILLASEHFYISYLKVHYVGLGETNETQKVNIKKI